MMAAAARFEELPAAAALIQILEAADRRPDDALRAAVPRAHEISPAVIATVEAAVSRTPLSRSQENLLFWGIHVLAAARRTELYQPIIRLVRETEEAELGQLLGDATTETLSGVVISVFDGDPNPLIEACSDPKVNGFARWALIGALTRLTFDGAVPRNTMLVFLDRFDREPLAEPDDVAWEGWQDAISLLGLEEMRDRLIAACREGRFEQDDSELDFSLNEINVARSLTAGDASLFARQHLDPIHDPVEALSWVHDPDAGSDDDSFLNDHQGDLDDPAADTALDAGELAWLRECLATRPPSARAMTLEQLDGYFCALTMDPHWSRVQECLSDIFDPSDETPCFDNDEQAERATRLLRRHVQTIVARLDSGYVHAPLLGDTGELRGQLWSKGFVKGMQVAGPDWHNYLNNDEIREFLTPILALQVADGEEDQGIRMTSQLRADVIASLPLALLGLYAAVQLEAERLRKQPATSSKIGRNEPCPCGSGKKFKRCCGSAEKRSFN